MKECPILFNGPMVRAILEGRKTQTRRIAKFKPLKEGLNFGFSGLVPSLYATGLPQHGWVLASNGACWNDRTHPLKSPFGLTGDRLWVRETHQVNRVGFEESWSGGRVFHAGVKYQADDGRADFEIEESLYQDFSDTDSRGWTPSIHMPRWASRITLEVTGVRVERLRRISDTNAEAEGIDFLRHVPDVDETLTARDLFRCLWDSVSAPGADWEANPWVWVIDFDLKRVNGTA